MSSVSSKPMNSLESRSVTVSSILVVEKGFWITSFTRCVDAVLMIGTSSGSLGLSIAICFVVVNTPLWRYNNYSGCSLRLCKLFEKRKRPTLGFLKRH